MLSPVVIILLILIRLPDRTSQSETIQAALASAVELPCSVGQNIEPTHAAKVKARMSEEDKCLCVRVAFVIVDLLG